MFFNTNVDIWHICEPGFLGPSLYYYVGLCVEQAKPQCSHEFLWPTEFPGTFSALGSDGILTSTRKFHNCGSFRYVVCWFLLKTKTLNEQSLNENVLFLKGIAVGHVYFFLEDVFPNQPGGGRWLKTPSIMLV